MHTATQWKEQANKLEKQKNNLNAYVECLHEKSVFGISPYGAIARSVYHGENTALRLTWDQRHGTSQAPINDEQGLVEYLATGCIGFMQ